MEKHLIVYFSRKGENYWDGGIRSLPKGNTEMVAEMIQRAVGGSLFELQTTAAYPEAYHDCVRVAVQELREAARPALARLPDSLAEYDAVFLGYPNWCGTCPMPVFSFLEAFDMTGKRIFPFCTNEGSGLGHSEADLQRACSGAKVYSGLSVKGSQAAGAEDTVAMWAKRSLEKS